MAEPVARTPGVCGGRPCVAGTRIRVELLVEDFLSGMSVAEQAEAYELTVEQVENALRWHANGGDTKCFTVWFIVEKSTDGSEDVAGAEFDRGVALTKAARFAEVMGRPFVTRGVRCHVPLKRKPEQKARKR
jgi:uncharacterized protein (DUF433 family)